MLIGASAPGFDSPSSEYQSPQWPDAVKAFESADFKRVPELDADIWVVGRDRDRSEVSADVLEFVEVMDLAALRTESRREERRNAPQLKALPHVDIPLIVVGEHVCPN